MNQDNMRLSLKQLKSLSVETVSGVKLGRVCDIVFEIEGQLVAQYVVRQSAISTRSLIVSRDQVIRFEREKMIVDDGAARQSVEETKKSAVSAPDPVMMRRT